MIYIIYNSIYLFKLKGVFLMSKNEELGKQVQQCFKKAGRETSYIDGNATEKAINTSKVAGK